MNREIKFRAWLKNEKKMVEVTKINFEEQYIKIAEPYYPKINFRGISIPFEQVDLMQYTGIKDKNGVEIYEGDVFIDEYDGCIGVIRYIEPSAWFVIEWYENSHSKEPINDDILGTINIHNMEVIGNIYENKELLNENN